MIKATHKRGFCYLCQLSASFLYLITGNCFFLPDLDTFKTKNHIGCSLKISLTFQPAYPALAILQSYKLLFHFSAAFRTNSISHKLLCTPLLETLTPVGSKSGVISIFHSGLY